MKGKIELSDGNAPLPADLRLRVPSMLSVADLSEAGQDAREVPIEAARPNDR